MSYGYTKNIPYGYRPQLVPHTEEQAIITRIGDMYYDQGLSQYEICRQLNKEGVKHRGRQWLQPTVCRILKREFKDRQRVQRATSKSVPEDKISWRELARLRWQHDAE